MFDNKASEVSEANEMTFLRYEIRNDERVALFNRMFEIEFIMGNERELIESDASYDKAALKVRVANLEKAGRDVSVSKAVLKRWPKR